MSKKLPAWLNSKNALIGVLMLMLIFLLIEKIYIYTQFSVKYTDEDQCVLWLAADELMHGHFREPCFFGQDYNSSLEGWLSIPFFWMGMNFNEAIPLTTLIMSLLPFLWISRIYFKAKEYLVSILLLFCLLMFSLEYQLVSVLPRGFITGLFCFGIAYALLLKKVKYHFFWFSFFSAFGFLLHETTAFLIFPIACHLLMDNFKNKKFYLQSFAGLILPAVYKVYIYLFYYVMHPEYVYFRKEKLNWTLKNFTGAFAHLDWWLFGDFSLFALTFAALLFLFLFKKKYIHAFILLSGYFLVFMMFGLTRMQEGVESVLFSKSRLMIFVPLMIAVYFAQAVPLWNFSLKKQAQIALTLLVIVSFHWFSQMSKVKDKIQAEVKKEPKIVAFLPVTTVYETSYKYIQLCKKSGNDFLLFDGASQVDAIYNLSIPLLSGNTITTFAPFFDRRTWVYKDVLKRTPEKIVVLRNWAERYDRPPLQKLKRRLISGGEDCMVEYYLQRNIEFSVWFDFQIPLRIHAKYDAMGR